MEYNIRVYKPELKQEEGKINNLKRIRYYYL